MDTGISVHADIKAAVQIKVLTLEAAAGKQELFQIYVVVSEGVQRTMSLSCLRGSFSSGGHTVYMNLEFLTLIVTEHPPRALISPPH